MQPLNAAHRLFNEGTHKDSEFRFCLGHHIASVVKLASRRFDDV